MFILPPKKAFFLNFILSHIFIKQEFKKTYERATVTPLLLSSKTVLSSRCHDALSDNFRSLIGDTFPRAQ